MRFSFIVGTVDRVKELGDFLEGLTRQATRDFEVIVVDQSDSDIFEDVIARYNALFPVRHVRSDVRKLRYVGHVAARKAVGEILAFPDDDCIFEPDTLAKVDRHFRDDPGLGFVTGAVLNLDGKPSAMGRWLGGSQDLTPLNAWIGLIEFNLFMRRSLYETVGGWDTNLGIGCRYGAAEGPDLAIRMIEAGGRGVFDRDLLVRHMDKSTTINGSRARAYARGMGYVMRKDAMPPRFVATMMIRSLGGAVVSAVRGRRDLVQYYVGTFVGRMEGYFSQDAAQAARERRASAKDVRWRPDAEKQA
ncbi:glycosyltransferase family 2 protein [Acidomonas methanolica]|uniref:glycosyltransferase family 2 protein n=1 Tax=Acidomonas methanolica TaxID=437 RepID=UPI00211A6C03|nr:glycosyltransferase family A protein [Acidomonas methanolica]MCQ9156501.1 glycosyltransferase family 2 protein [Acidomonas methanolica]